MISMAAGDSGGGYRRRKEVVETGEARDKHSNDAIARKRWRVYMTKSSNPKAEHVDASTAARQIIITDPSTASIDAFVLLLGAFTTPTHDKIS